MKRVPARLRIGLLCGIIGAVSGCRQVPDKSPNVVVITMDTTRADHLGCYGYADIQTPRIDALAAGGVLFEEAFSVQPVTLPSHCSIFTGKYPFHNGVRDNNIYKLSDRNVTLAEILSDRGYLTTAFIGSYILSNEFGLSQGFHFYNDKFVKPKQKGMLPVDRRASEISFLVDEWLTAVQDVVRETPFFLWIHYYDPHADYDPPHPYKTAYANPYDGEIAYTDDWIGFFFDSLKSRGLWDNTLIVLTGDHGESLGEYGEMTHGMFIYRPATHVPLILHHPGLLPAGKRIQNRVSSVDIVPTVLDLLGVETGTDFDGISLKGLIRGEPAAPGRAVYSEAFIPRGFNWSELKGIRKDDWFFIEAPNPELYRIGVNGREKDNLYGSDRSTADRLDGDLQTLTASENPDIEEHVAVDDEMTKRLQALGYFVANEGSLSDSSPEQPRPDPKEMIAYFNLYQRAESMIVQGEVEAGVELLKKVVEKDPDNPRFLVDLGSAMIDLQQFDEAKVHLEHAIEINDKNQQAHFLLGSIYREQGRADDALKAFQEVIALNPKQPMALQQAGLILIGKQRWDEAADCMQKCLAQRPDDPVVLNNLGYIEIVGRQDLDKGIGLIRKALEKQPDNPSLLVSLGTALKKAGNYREAAKHLKRAVEIAPEEAAYQREYRAIRDLAGSDFSDVSPPATR